MEEAEEAQTRLKALFLFLRENRYRCGRSRGSSDEIERHIDDPHRSQHHVEESGEAQTRLKVFLRSAYVLIDNRVEEAGEAQTRLKYFWIITWKDPLEVEEEGEAQTRLKYLWDVGCATVLLVEEEGEAQTRLKAISAMPIHKRYGVEEEGEAQTRLKVGRPHRWQRSQSGGRGRGSSDEIERRNMTAMTE